VDLDARGRRLRAALAAALVPHNAPEVQLVRRWLDSWSGVGLVLAGMAHRGYDVQLTAYAARDWRATWRAAIERLVARRFTTESDPVEANAVAP